MEKIISYMKVKVLCMRKLIEKKWFLDALLITVIVIISLTIILINKERNSNNLKAQIWYEDTLVKEIDLNLVSKKTKEDITLPSGVVITIEYDHGRIRTDKAPCRTRDCINTGWVSNVNKPIICMDLHYKIVLIQNDMEVDASL